MLMEQTSVNKTTETQDEIILTEIKYFVIVRECNRQYII